MPRSESYMPGADVVQAQQVGTGVLGVHPKGTLSSTAFSAHGDCCYGPVECWRGKCKSVADVAYDAAGAICVIGGTKPARNTSYRILKVTTTLRSLRTGNSPDHDLKVETGDGASSEAFTSLVATVDIDSDTVNLPTERILVAAETILLAGETLRAQMSVAGTTTTGTAECDFEVYVQAVNA